MMTATKPREPRTQPFDPHLATVEADAFDRVALNCPSRREFRTGYLLLCEEDGTKAWCSCDGYTFHGHCTHTEQAPEITRLAHVNHYDALGEAELRSEAAQLRALLGEGTATSIRYRCLTDEIAKRERLRDRALLNERGRKAKADLFG